MRSLEALAIISLRRLKPIRPAVPATIDALPSHPLLRR
jgi:hypothetical protein